MASTAEWTVGRWLVMLEAELDSDSSAGFAHLLSLQHPSSFSPKYYQRSAMDRLEQNNVTQAMQDRHLAQIVYLHVQVIRALHGKQMEKAYDLQEQAILTCADYIKESTDSSWPIKMMVTLANDLTRLAITADNLSVPMLNNARAYAAAAGQMQPQPTTGTDELKDRAANHLTTLFRICAGDKTQNVERSKRIGMLPLVNCLVKINFLLDRLQLCMPLIRAVENSGLLEKYGNAELVPYRYYLAQSYLRKGEFKQAEELLSLAFDNCPAEPASNVALILTYLIPLRLMRGLAPPATLVEQRLPIYVVLIDAVKKGDFTALDMWMQHNHTFVEKFKLWVMLEGGIKLMMARNVLRRLQAAFQQHIVPIDAYARALTLSGFTTPFEKETSVEHAECVLVNLIAFNMVKGYISHKHKKVVLAKQSNAFPAWNLEKPSMQGT